MTSPLVNPTLRELLAAGDRAHGGHTVMDLAPSEEGNLRLVCSCGVTVSVSPAGLGRYGLTLTEAEALCNRRLGQLERWH